MPESIPITQPGAVRVRFWREWELVVLMMLVGACYFGRLTALSIRGEESRRALVACEMLDRGDWIVPRQQGAIYLSRPPLGSWLIALASLARGKVDALAIRLPSATAVLLTTLLIYAYSRGFLTRLGAFAAAAAYATLPQVLDLGRLGETEAVFTLLVSGSLLIWHWGYCAAWPAAATWAAGYAFAALAGMDKGPQGPLYFVAPVVAYLGWKRDWKFLFSWPHAVGVCIFALVLGAWQIPFLYATDWQAVWAIWCDNVRERFVDPRPLALVAHLVSYPLEVFGCLLPWSCLLGLFALPGFRRSLVASRPQLQFLSIALAVTFATVWFTPAAKGRYFMPLYPCLAALVGIVVDACMNTYALNGEARDAERSLRLARNVWRTFLWTVGAIAGIAGVAAAAVGLLSHFSPPSHYVATASAIGCAPAYLLGCCLLAVVLALAGRQPTVARARWGILAVAGFLGLTYLTVVIDLRIALSADVCSTVAGVKDELPPGVRLVSLGSVDHLFAYLYATEIPMEPEPTETQSPAPDIEYFCFNEHPPNTVRWPFAWQRVATVPLERNRVSQPHRTVVIGRRVPDATAGTKHESALVKTAKNN